MDDSGTELKRNELARPDEPPLRVMSLHALAYCERLFYLEEVEEIRVADANVYAGRRLHEERVPEEDHPVETRALEVSSEEWGLFGKLDAVRKRDGNWVAYEHKRGRPRKGHSGPEAWPSDRVQAIAYAVLLAEHLGEPVLEARIRYHGENVTVRVPVDESARSELRSKIVQARELRRTNDRPPVHDNERVCRSCSLNVVCLPEEERLAKTDRDTDEKADTRGGLFPTRRDRTTIHVATPRSRVTRRGDSIVVERDGDSHRLPLRQVDALVLHGSVQVTTQALTLCRYQGVAVQWVTGGGRVVGTLAVPGRVRQRIRQYEALTQPANCLRLARQLITAKVDLQRQYALRQTRGNETARAATQTHLDRMKDCLTKLPDASNLDTVRGLEGMAAKSYFAALPSVLADRVPESLRFAKRVKHPPPDRFNCLLGFGYSLVYALVERTLLSVGLETTFGFFHQPRSAAPPLVLDVMELFRTVLWEVPLVGSLNRGQWHERDDFELRPGHVWLSESGRKKAIGLFEQRLSESYLHPHTGASLEYGRMVELECRLLEKEWTGAPGSFARLRLR